ncbi:MAG: aspartate aminotransferase family protein [archaeon]|nr:aspartate aminotransferase family protein [archaeon]
MNTQELIDIEDKYFINTFTRQPIVLDHGEGIKVWDIDGNEYYDFLAGIAVNCLGHNHPRLVKAIQDQAEKLIHISSIYYNEPATVYAKKLIDATSFDRIFYSNSGAEANEGAIKLALKYTGKSEILYCGSSFHGRTILTLAVTDHPEYSAPYAKNMPKGFKKVEYGNLESIKEAITAETAAIIIEPIQGEGGVNVPSKEFFKGLESLCKEKGILLIVDEVQSGFGRAGSLFAHELFDIKPDIMTMAKGIGGGVPMGGILATEEVATGFVPGDHGTTFAGGPLVAAAANVVFDELTSEGFLDNVNEVGNYFKDELIKLQEKYDLIAEVRGKGLIVGVELTQPGGEFVDKFREKGFLINCTVGNVLRFVPPLIASKEDIDKLIVAFDELLSS